MPQGRTAAKLIRFAPDELAAVNRRARTCGRTPARFIPEGAASIPRGKGYGWHSFRRAFANACGMCRCGS
jgi:hypothetical protein